MGPNNLFDELDEDQDFEEYLDFEDEDEYKGSEELSEFDRDF